MVPGSGLLLSSGELSGLLSSHLIGLGHELDWASDWTSSAPSGVSLCCTLLIGILLLALLPSGHS